MTQDLSLGELQSLCVKATRGAGRAVGVAEDAGHAVRWLTARGEEGAGALVALLRATDGLPVGDMIPALPAFTPVKQGLCPLALGGYLSDMGVLPDGPLGPVWSPILLLPFLAKVTPHGVDIDPDTMALTPRATPRAATQTRAQVSLEILNALNTFAARTYAPATEQSRAGAGAGTSDND
ncbi:DUF3726 domain-containing protein [Gymnodinialimonas sp.]